MGLPGESAGRLISIQPARGPELIRRKSLLILDSVTAQDLTAPDTARKKSGFLETVEEYSTGKDAGNGRVLNYISADGKKFSVDGLVGRVEFYVSHQKDGDGLVNRTYKLKIDDSLFQAHMASLKKNSAGIRTKSSRLNRGNHSGGIGPRMHCRSRCIAMDRLPLSKPINTDSA